MGYDMHCGSCKGDVDEPDRFCRHCGCRFVQAGARRELKVKSYRYQNQMERDMAKMMEQGWRIEAQTGRFSPAMRVFRAMDKVTVTWLRG